MANLFGFQSQRIANQIEDTLVYVLRNFFAMDDTYTYADINPEESEDPEDPEQEPRETNIVIVSEYAIKENEDDAIPMIIVGNTAYDMNFSMTLGNNFIQPYRAPHTQQLQGEDDPIVGTQHITVIPFSCTLTFLGQNELEVEMLAEQLVNYFAVILNQTMSMFGIDIHNMRFGAAAPKSNYPKRNYVCALSINGVLNGWQINVSEQSSQLFEEFIVNFIKQ